MAEGNTLPRFLVPPEGIHGNHFTLTGPEARHALRVLRMKAGDTLDLFDGKDRSYLGRIEACQGDEINGVLLETRQPLRLPVEITLYQAISKGEKWDWLVEKVSEIGVARLIPVESDRSVGKKEMGDNKRHRWERIALAAAKQSGRTDVMQIESPRDLLTTFSQLSDGDLSLIPSEKESSRSIRTACEGFAGKRVNIFIGPEGGWAPSELEMAGQSGVIAVRLGPTLLRTETAGLIAATLVFREFGVY